MTSSGQNEASSPQSQPGLRYYRPDWMEGIIPMALIELWVERESRHDLAVPRWERRAVVEETLRSGPAWRGYVQDQKETS